jgi:methionine-S-sulfoxide reductase
MSQDIENLAKATFAGGCFWCMEPPFNKIDGVVSTVSGYTGGHKENPTYQEVSAGTTGHVEALQVTYDPQKTDYSQLLEVFWQNINPVDADDVVV